MKLLVVLASAILFSAISHAQEARLSADLHEIKVVKSKTKVDKQFQEASEVISSALEVHRCLKRMGTDYNGQLASMRALNPNVVPGLDASKMQIAGVTTDFAPAFKFQYASPSKCIGISQIDTFTAIANNAFSMRVVYLAADSGETANFWYRLQKQDGGDWKILAISASGYFF